MDERPTDARQNAAHVYISPHLDDVVLSCGGRIWQLADGGARVLVVTMFAGSPTPDAPLSPFAQSLHQRWGHLADAALRRQDEDLAALAVLGAEPVHWPYTDCIYRQLPDGRFAYDSEESLWGAVHPLEAGLIAELASRLAALPLAPGGTMVGPLGIGHHVDHQLARRALASTRHPFTCYEDFPYAANLEAAQALVGDARCAVEMVKLSERALEAKIAAIACYRSQISTFWTDSTEMAVKVRAFATQVGGTQPAERYWRCPQAAQG